MKKIILFSLLAVTFFASCSDNDDDSAKTVNAKPQILMLKDSFTENLDENLAIELTDEKYVVNFSGEVTSEMFKLVPYSLNPLTLSPYEADVNAIRAIKLTPSAKTLEIDTTAVDIDSPSYLTLKFEDGNSIQKLNFVVAPKSNKEGTLLSNGKYTAVVSDIHMQDARADSFGYAFLKDNKAALLNYLSNIKDNNTSYKELVLLGDIVDEYSTALNTPGEAAILGTFQAADGTSMEKDAYDISIGTYNSEIVDAIKDTGVNLVYTPGNHDEDVSSSVISEIFGSAIKQYRDEKVPQVGSYKPYPNIIMEHGHRYDAFNGPDYYSTQGLSSETGVTTDNAALPMGYFISRVRAWMTIPAVATKIQEMMNAGGGSGNSPSIESVISQILFTSKSQDEANAELLKAFLTTFTGPLTKDQMDALVPSIDTGLCGMKGSYKFTEITPFGGESQKIYQNMTKQSEWEKRLAHNNAPTDISFLYGLLICEGDGYDQKVAEQVFKNDNEHNVVVFGHTHRPVLTAKKANNHSFIFANTGTWVDSKEEGYDTCTYVEIFNGDDGKQQVSLMHIKKDSEGNYSTERETRPLWVLNK